MSQIGRFHWPFQEPIAASLRGVIPRWFAEFVDNEHGATVVIVGLALPALVGAMGLGAEITYWQLHQRAMQNASDAAAIASATNTASNYASVAKAGAAQYGFTDGLKNVSVVAANPTTAPGCTSNCYTVTITDRVPLFLSQVVGYQGNTVVNGQSGTTLTATAVATTAKS
jgi:uncharacterized membrane protein